MNLFEFLFLVVLVSCSAIYVLAGVEDRVCIILSRVLLIIPIFAMALIIILLYGGTIRL